VHLVLQFFAMDCRGCGDSQAERLGVDESLFGGMWRSESRLSECSSLMLYWAMSSPASMDSVCPAFGRYWSGLLAPPRSWPGSQCRCLAGFM